MTASRRTKGVSLRKRIGVILLAVALAYTVVDHLVDRISMMPRYRELERELAFKDVQRCTNAIHREIEHLDVMMQDWAAWDDTYAFVIDRSPQYIDTNLGISTFVTNRLNLVHIADTAGETVWAFALDLQEEAPLPIQDLLGPIQAMHGPGSPHAHDYCAGILRTPCGAMLVAMGPILTSDDTGPSRGTFTMGRLLTEPFIENMRAQTEVNFSATPVDRLDDAGLALLSKVKESGGLLLDESATDALRIYAEMTDIHGNPGLLIEAAVPRTITQRGRAAAWSAMLSNLTAGMVILLVLMVLLRRSVVSPLVELTDEIVRINRTGNLTARIVPMQYDEIGTLAREFNHLLERLTRDIAERERTAAALLESEARIRAIVDAAADGVLTLDADGVIRSVNPAAEDMFGRPAGELVGRPMEEFVADGRDGESAVIAELLSAALRRPGGARAEGRGRRPDGGAFPLHLTANRIERGDAPTFAVIAGDLTEYTELQAKLMRAEHLAAIGEMGASVAHEIRNPLAGISSAIQVMDKSLPADDPRKPVFGEILTQVARLDQAVRGLLMFARPWNPEPKPCRVAAMLERACNAAASLPAFARVRFEVSAAPDLEAVVDGDLLEQVLQNLFGNAANAMPDGGLVRVEARRAGGMLRLTVQDSGEGIPPEALPRIFQPFFTTRTQGAGLGLAVCRRIVEAHGGTIHIASAPGRGACAIIEIPCGED